MNDTLVLVLSDNSMIAALLGALLETHGYRPCFAEEGESPRDALRRCRPGTIIVDCEDGGSCSDTVLGPARMTGTRIIMFAHGKSREDMRGLVERHGADFFSLPVDLPAFGQLLRGAET